MIKIKSAFYGFLKKSCLFVCHRRLKNMKKWYKVVNKVFDNFNSNYQYSIEEVIDDEDHSRDYGFHKTLKSAQKQIERLEYYHCID